MFNGHTIKAVPRIKLDCSDCQLVNFWWETERLRAAKIVEYSEI